MAQDSDGGIELDGESKQMAPAKPLSCPRLHNAVDRGRRVDQLFRLHNVSHSRRKQATATMLLRSLKTYLQVTLSKPNLI